MVTLARDLDLTRSGFLTGLTAIFVARLRHAPAGKVRALILLSCRHRRFPYVNQNVKSECEIRVEIRTSNPAASGVEHP